MAPTSPMWPGMGNGLGGGIGATGSLGCVPRVVVDVVLKPEISDPQGQAVLGALGRLGHNGVRSVRQGKHFVLEVDGTPDEAEDRKSTRLNSSHGYISYAVFCLKKK